MDRILVRKTKDEQDRIDLVKNVRRMVVTAIVNNLKLINIQRVKGLYRYNRRWRVQLVQHIKMDRSSRQRQLFYLYQ